MKKTLLLSIIAGAFIATSCEKGEEILPISQSSPDLSYEKQGASITMENSWVTGYWNPQKLDSSGVIVVKDTSFQIFQFTGYYIGIQLKATITGYGVNDSLYFYCVKNNNRTVIMEYLIPDITLPVTSDITITSYGNYSMGIGKKISYINPQGVTTDTIVLIKSTKQIVRAVR